MPNAADTLVAVGTLPWEALPGYPGVSVLNLSGDFDEANRSGRRTRLVRFDPGAATSRTLLHDYYEEAFLISGDLEGATEPNLFGAFSEPAYVLRPPGTLHGPIRSRGGCVMLEIHYYAG